MLALYTAIWIIAIVYSTIPCYWLIVHPRARRWVERGGRRLTAIGPVWLLLWVAAGAVTWPWRRITLYRLPWTWIPGVALVISGFVIYNFARQGFSMDQALGRSELEPLKHEQMLRTSGIRRHIRHPYYLGHLCELAGWTLGSGLAVLFALTLFGMVTGYFMIRAEERELEHRFSEEYRAYRQRAAAIFPGIW